MRVLSLFDGMSCGQIALKEIGITPEVYYASEIDKFAIKQTQLNFPNTIQVGDVRDLNVEDLGHIDLILSGSPCTDMSFSGKRKGLSTVEGIEIKSLNEYLELKKQGFEFSGQSYLFWEFIRILNDARKTNPEVLFLLENVKMGKKWEPVFDDAIGCKGNHINSALVSAQVRKRIYWTNIQDRNNFIIQRALHGDFRIRRLTPTECSRLQTVPNWYKWECSETQQYKMLGNGWTIKVIEHILKRIKES